MRYDLVSSIELGSWQFVAYFDLMSIPSSRLLMASFVLALVAGITAIVAGDSTAQSVVPKQASQPFSITISTQTPTVKAGSSVSIKIRLTNISRHSINASSAYFVGVDASYMQEVRDSNGNLAEREYSEPDAQSGHWVLHTLKPGESATSVTGISPQYDINRAGQYVIQLSRAIAESPKYGVVKSNTIEITVTP